LSKNLLVLGAGNQAIEGLRQLAAEGWRLVGCDIDRNAPGFVYCADTIIASAYHFDQCLPKIETYHNMVQPIDGVMCLAIDAPHVAARIAHHLMLPGISIATADLSVNKVALKSRFLEQGIPTPAFREIYHHEELQDFAIRYPNGVVVKPADSRGSKGVSWVRRQAGLYKAFFHAQEWSPSRRVIVEDFMPGPQISTESIILDGVAYTVGISDRNYELLEKYAPYIVENGGDLPSLLSDEHIKNAHNVIQSVATALELTNGIIKGDLVFNGRQAFVIEVALRLSGGYFCTYEIPLNTGVSTVLPVARLAMGLRVNPDHLTPKFRKYVIQRYIFPTPGYVTSVAGIEKICSMEHVAHAEVWSKIGDYIQSPKNAGGSAGVVMTCAPTRKEALETMQKALTGIRITTKN